MTFSFNHFLSALYVRSAGKKQAKYLEAVTPDSILHSLSEFLRQDRADIHTPEAIFNACSVKDSSQELPYWTKESLATNIRNRHPETVFPDNTINVLWSCFYYYAYHPFPRQYKDTSRLEYPAFERALILLAVQGTQALGTLREEGGQFWRSDGHCSRRQGIKRIFRSIGRVSHDSDRHDANLSTCMVDEVMDALAMTDPYLQHHQSPELLKPVAKRLLQDAETRYQTDMDSLSTLLCLMNRLQVHEKTWGRGFRHGSFEESNFQKEELANILAQPFQLSQAGLVSPDAVLHGLNILPNLEQRFHQLWATIFQPPLPEGDPTQTVPSPDYSIDDVLRATALFIPPFGPDSKDGKDPRSGLVTFKPCCHSKNDLNDNLPLDRILQIISQDRPGRFAHLVLFIGSRSPNSISPVVGGFFPRATKNRDVGKGTREVLDDLNVYNPELLFQLRPSFSIFQCEKTTRMPLIAPAIETEPYWIGDSEELSASLKIDPISRLAIFTQRDTAGKETNMYKRVFPRSPDIAMPIDAGGDSGTVFKVDELAILRVEGGEGASIDRLALGDAQSSWKAV